MRPNIKVFIELNKKKYDFLYISYMTTLGKNMFSIYYNKVAYKITITTMNTMIILVLVLDTKINIYTSLFRLSEYIIKKNIHRYLTIFMILYFISIDFGLFFLFHLFYTNVFVLRIHIRISYSSYRLVHIFIPEV